MDVTLEGWNHHNDPAMKASNQPGGSLHIDGEFQEERMTEHKRLHDLFQDRVASKTPYLTKELLKDARNLLELDLILLVGSDLTWDKPQRVARRTDEPQTGALIRPPQAASGGGVNNDEDSDEGSEDNDDDDKNEDDDDDDDDDDED